MFPFFLFTSNEKQWLIGNLQSSQSFHTSLKPKGIGKDIQCQAQVTLDYFVADARAWEILAGIIIYFHSPYSTEHTDNA